MPYYICSECTGGQLGCRFPQNHDGPHEVLPDTRNYCTFGREDKLRIVPRFGIPAALSPKPCN